ncbi:MAG: cytochrome P450 [Pikeienuella sp.]
MSEEGRDTPIGDDAARKRALFTPPKPPTRAMEMSALARWRAARRSIFDALKPTLYRAWLAELKTPFRNSYFVNDPSILKVALHQRPDDFPKANSIRASLHDLLGEAVFLTNGEAWHRQRRMIDPAFEGGRLRDTFPAMVAAAESCADRLAARADGTPVEMEFETSYFAADVIFRTLFSEPIETGDAQEIFTAFRRYQQTAPILNALDLMNAPRWIPRPRRRQIRREAQTIRALLRRYVDRRAAEIAAGTAPDDLATKIMTTTDPVTGDRFTAEEMLDQVAIFFLAGHETSASALGWAVYLLASDKHTQARAAAEVGAISPPPEFGDIRRLAFTRDVYRETLRLYPPVPMMVRETARKENFRNRKVAKGSIFIMSPWHLHRHERLWSDGDVFDPDRWARADEADSRRDAYMPFSAGPRVCSGAGFAMLEGVLFLATILRRFELSPVADRQPAPITQLTVRSETGIWLSLTPRR